MLKIIFQYLVFPGFLFAVVVGLFAGWVDRKVTARIQYRVGPPWYQNFMDIAKLFCKEIVVPRDGSVTFLLAPFLGLAGMTLAAAIIGMGAGLASAGFTGDSIVVLYLLTMPAVALTLGALASRNPFASVGASREIKLVLGYELPFILSVLTVIIKTGGAIGLGAIIARQQSAGSYIFSFSGVLAFIAALLCMQAKLGYVPFDMSEAEQEIVAGALIEYSGLPLAVFKLTKALILYALPLFLILLFMAKDLHPWFLIGKYILLLVIIILIKNTNPRLRIDQALRFFWGPVTVMALLALGLAVVGL